MGMRRDFAEKADRLGFGQVVRVHRERRDASGVVIWLVMGLLPVGILVVIAFEEDSQLWRLPVLGYALLMWVVVAWIWWGEVEDPKGRRWFATTEGGLLAWQPDSGLRRPFRGTSCT